nr:reverse transcriptase domain-containing protein [Tanacetum cinerariifolium]
MADRTMEELLQAPTKGRRIQHIVEPEFRSIENIVSMGDRTMEELLQAPTEGYGEAIVIPEILAENFEIKTNLLQLVQANKFHGRENDNPHTHISNFKRMTATLKYRDVPNDAIKLMFFPYSLEDRARIWVCPHHGFLELTQLDMFYNSLTEQDRDSLNAASGGSTAQIQPPVVPISIPESDVSRTQPKPTIPYPSRLNDQKLREKATNQMEKFFQIFHDFHFDISCADALLLMPKFASTIKSLLTNKDKLFELEKVPLNENCSVMLLKKLLEKLGDPDFVVVDFEADQRVSLILGRSFLRTSRALINVYGEEITLRVNDESVTFDLNQTMRYSSTYDDNYVNRDIACEEFVQDVLDFQYNSKSSNPTLVSDPLISESGFSKESIVKSSSPTLTPFGESDFFIEEIEDFLNDDSIPTGIDNSFYDPEGDILFS